MDVMAPKKKEAWQFVREKLLLKNAQSGDKQLERAVLLFERLMMEQKTDALLLESQELFEKFEKSIPCTFFYGMCYQFYWLRGERNPVNIIFRAHAFTRRMQVG